MEKREIKHYIDNGYFETPKELQIEITNRCSLSCPQCYKADTVQKDMDIALFSRIIDEAESLGIKTLVLNGGEPFEHEKIISVLELLEKYNFQVLCISSGMGLSSKIIEKISEIDLDFQLSISLNGSSKEIHSLSRDGYEISLKAIDELNKMGINFGINWVCRNDNIRDFPNLVRLAVSHNAKWINIAANKLTGRGDIISPLEADDYIFLVEFLRNQEIVKKKFIRVQYCFALLNDLRGFGVNKHISGCPAGTLSLCIDVNGSFLPCTHLMFPEKFDSILEYWNQSDKVKALRYLKNNKKNCNGCLKPEPCHYCRMMFTNTGKNIFDDPLKCPLKNIYQKERLVKNVI